MHVVRMEDSTSFWIKYVLIGSLTALVIAVPLSLFSSYGYTKALFAVLCVWTGWLFIGHLITFDDNLPGGWDNPDGDETIGCGAFLVKGLAFALVATVFLSFL